MVVGPVAENSGAGIASFEKLGFPTARNEDWKYTNVGPLAAAVFERDEHSGNDKKKLRRMRSVRCRLSIPHTIGLSLSMALICLNYPG